jgi:hypothetical protein
VLVVSVGAGGGYDVSNVVCPAAGLLRATGDR